VGESVAVNGACLTVVDFEASKYFEVELSKETLSRTTFGEMREKSPLNLERALQLQDRLGGHVVSGHVDGVGRVYQREDKGEFTLFKISFPEDFAAYLVEKGSVALDGISLTVNGIDDAERIFEITIIPHTLEKTHMKDLKEGDGVHLEGDLLGKYVKRLMGLGFPSDKDLPRAKDLKESSKHER
jgi:riboflavin synthase